MTWRKARAQNITRKLYSTSKYFVFVLCFKFFRVCFVFQIFSCLFRVSNFFVFVSCFKFFRVCFVFQIFSCLFRVSNFLVFVSCFKFFRVYIDIHETRNTRFLCFVFPTLVYSCIYNEFGIV